MSGNIGPDINGRRTLPVKIILKMIYSIETATKPKNPHFLYRQTPTRKTIFRTASIPLNMMYKVLVEYSGINADIIGPARNDPRALNT